MKMFILTILAFLSISLNAQDEMSTKGLVSQYKIKLDLTKEQTSSLVLIIENFSKKIHSKNLDNKEFNKTNKLRDLEIYKLLSKEQFEKYKKAKLEIEPTLKFRFN